MATPDLAGLAWPRETARLRLRPATLKDVDAILTFRSLPEVVRYLSHDPMTRDEVVARVTDRMARGRIDADRPCLGLLVEGLDGRVIGDAMLSLEPSRSISRTRTDEWEGVIGYALHPDAHGWGLATEIGRELLRLGFADLGLRRIAADAYADNVASNRVLAKLGMRLEGTVREHSLGKGGIWLDDNTWAVLRREWQPGPGPGSR